MAATMDFFARQDAARRTTRWLVVWFVLAVAAIVVAVWLAAELVLRAGFSANGDFSPALLLGVTAGVSGLVVAAALFRTAQLRQGGPAVARLLGGTPVEPGVRDERLLRLRNVVEEMAIASGVPVPHVFVLEQENGINAFAAGWGTRDAAVAVTRGALDQLDRDELQGVIAHEFSHVFHGDMRLNIRLMGVLFGIVCIATVGEILLRTMGRGRSRGGKNNGAALALFGVLLFLIGWIGVFFAGLIKAAVSRQREFLADAAAVGYTRNPRGLGSALARIAGHGSRIGDAHAREASHMFFADAMARFGSLGATHPPVEERIERILPGWRRARASAGDPVAAVQQVAAPAPAGVAAMAPGRVPSSAVLDRVGTTDAQLVAHSRELLAALPLDVVAATREPPRTAALMAALLVQPGDDAQDAVLQARPPALAFEVRQLATALRGLDRTRRLPLVELAVPALRALPLPERAAMHDLLTALALADGAMSTFEFALLRLVRQHAPPHDRPATPGRRSLLLPNAAAETALVLSAIAWTSGDEAAATRAFAAGRDCLPAELSLALLPRAQCRFAAIDQAVQRLEQLSPMATRALLAACAAAAAADGSIATTEGELLRAFAACWDCPLPPLWRA